jgi:cell division protein FtsL
MRPARPAGPVAVQPSAGACALRALPHEDVFFFCKKIDNSRLVREPDPKARGACWNVIGAACLAVIALGVASAPKVTTIMDGYKLEALRSEEQRLLDERRALELQEAQLVSPDRLERLAKGHNLVTPAGNQVYHLEARPDGTVAMAK